MRHFYLTLLLLAGVAHGATTETYKGRVISAKPAAADYTSAWFDTSNASSVSVHCLWASLTGTLDGQFLVDVSNDGGTNDAPKSGATLTVSGATGDDVISLNGVVTEEKYRVRWVHNNVSGGTVNCYVAAKG